MAILNIGSRGLIERGFLCPLLEYAVRNGIQAEALTISESIWRDQGGCIARRNFAPFQSEEVYQAQLVIAPFNFGIGAAAMAATAVAATAVAATSPVAAAESPDLWIKLIFCLQIKKYSTFHLNINNRRSIWKDPVLSDDQ